ncbi:MFS transporter [Roseibium sp.]|uniref:MFS transporter n=1 Tax=Roseibium sp. TaxID=1936156 RepID=UPI0032980474
MPPKASLRRLSLEAQNQPDRSKGASERRRISRRDEAKHWALLRDLRNPELWIERYHAAIWLDYIRHNKRRTQEDAQNTNDIRALHAGSRRPKVHRMIEHQHYASRHSRHFPA